MGLGGGAMPKSRTFLAFILVFLLAFSTLSSISYSQLDSKFTDVELDIESKSSHSSSDDASLVDYKLYFTELPDSNNDGQADPEFNCCDGYITTEKPDGEDEEEVELIAGDRTFTTPFLLSDMTVKGIGGGSIELYVFMYFRGPNNATAEVSFELAVNGVLVDSITTSMSDPCNGFTSTCGYSGRLLSFDSIPDGLVVASEKTLQIVATVPSTNGCDGGVFSGDCEVWVAFGDVDGQDQFSHIKVRANALGNSQLKVHHFGGGWNDAETLTWYPNDIPEAREMHFSVDIRNSFGRFDIDSVLVSMNPESSSTNSFEKEFDDNELTLDNDGLVGNFNWSYQKGISHGEYELNLIVTDIQGHTISFDHDDIIMAKYGLRFELDDGYTDNILIAPAQESSVEFTLTHIGGGNNALEVELELQRNMGADWTVEFDSDGYDLDYGGYFLHPTLTITPPTDDLSEAPDSILVVATATNDSGDTVHTSTIELTIEEIGVHAPPRLSVYSDVEHQIQIADSVVPETFDENIPRFAEDDTLTSFYVDIFNSGFDNDYFRMRIKEIPRGWIALFVDNTTGAEINVDLEDATYHTPELASHTYDTIRMDVRPSSNRDDPDKGLLILEVLSGGNGTKKSEISFTVQRTYGVHAEVVYDCDSLPYGVIDLSISTCTGSTFSQETMRVKVTNSMQTGSEVITWQIKNPSSLDKELTFDDGQVVNQGTYYDNWDFDFYDQNGSVTPYVQLSSGDSQEIKIVMSAGSGVKAGNHTLFLRILEDTQNAEPRYFDMPMTFVVEEDTPSIEITQKSAHSPIAPGESREVQMKIYNVGNSDVLVLMEVETSDGWSASVKGNPLIEVSSFSEVNFTVIVTSPESLRHGDIVNIILVGRPIDTEENFGDEFDASTDIKMQGEVIGMSRVMSELTNPRPTTIFIGLGGLVILTAWGARRRTTFEFEEEYEEEFEEETSEEEEESKIEDIPNPVVHEDTIELVDE